MILLVEAPHHSSCMMRSIPRVRVTPTPQPSPSRVCTPLHPAGRAARRLAVLSLAQFDVLAVERLLMQAWLPGCLTIGAGGAGAGGRTTQRTEGRLVVDAGRAARRLAVLSLA